MAFGAFYGPEGFFSIVAGAAAFSPIHVAHDHLGRTLFHGKQFGVAGIAGEGAVTAMLEGDRSRALNGIMEGLWTLRR